MIYKQYVSLNIYMYEWHAAWKKHRYYVRMKAYGERQTETCDPATHLLWNPTQRFAIGHRARPSGLALTRHMLDNPPELEPVFYNSSEPKWMDPEEEAKLVDDLKTMPAQPEILDIRLGAEEGQRLQLMLKSAHSWVNIRRKGRCPNVGHYQTTDPPRDQPLNVESTPDIDFQIGFELNNTILMAQRMAQVEILRSGASPAQIEAVRQNLWRMILMYGIMHSEHPELHESPQKLLWMKDQIGTAAWHRVRMEGVAFPAHVATHKPMTLARAREDVARGAQGAAAFHLFLATCDEQGPNPSTRKLENAKRYFCEQCGITAEAGAILCPTCEKILLPDNLTVRTLDNLGDPLSIKIADMLERACKFCKIDRQLLPLQGARRRYRLARPTNFQQ